MPILCATQQEPSLALVNASNLDPGGVNHGQRSRGLLKMLFIEEAPRDCHSLQGQNQWERYALKTMEFSTSGPGV
jgi:hypothetical protein